MGDQEQALLAAKAKERSAKERSISDEIEAAMKLIDMALHRGEHRALVVQVDDIETQLSFGLAARLPPVTGAVEARPKSAVTIDQPRQRVAECGPGRTALWRRAARLD